MVKNYASLDHFAADFRRFARELTEGLVVEYHKENHREGRRLLQKELDDVSVTGELAGSLRDSSSRGAKRPEELTKPGTTAVVSLDQAFHALDFGRRRSKPYRRGARKGSTRTLGLESKPRGFTTPAVEKLTSTFRQAKLRRKAFRKAWRDAK